MGIKEKFGVSTKRLASPVQLNHPQFGSGPLVEEISDRIRAAECRTRFAVAGEDVTVAVLDTGSRTTHVDFDGRIPAQRNFTADNNADATNASDGHGHGTNCAGIMVANGGHDGHTGIAPSARHVPMKVVANNGRGNFVSIVDALQWIIEHHDAYDISCIVLPVGDGGNYLNEGDVPHRALCRSVQDRVRRLREVNIATIASAGSDYFGHGSRPGMAFPAILPECISVGSVFDAAECQYRFNDGAVAFAARPDQLMPNSQRLSIDGSAVTDIFAPGTPVTSTGIFSDTGESVQDGSGQAVSVAAGVILLMQSFYKQVMGELPRVDDLTAMLRQSALPIHDHADSNDNVINTGETFGRIDAVSAVAATKRYIERLLLAQESRLNLPQLDMPATSAPHTAVKMRPQKPTAVVSQTPRASTAINNTSTQRFRCPDERVPAARPSISPYRTIGHIIVDLSDGRRIERPGALVSDFTVLTAGDLVKDGDNAFHAIERLRFIPARNDPAQPYGHFDWVHMRAVHNESANWALISLAEPAGYSVGYLGTSALGVGEVPREGLSRVTPPADSHADEFWIDADPGIGGPGDGRGFLIDNWFTANPQLIELSENAGCGDQGTLVARRMQQNHWLYWLHEDFAHRNQSDRIIQRSKGTGTANLTTDTRQPDYSLLSFDPRDDGPLVHHISQSAILEFLPS